ncbi:M23 family metallopeptidase [Candidatus Daviesbacteria bacterium]|nr:M23 family metallopeptidase [Candidatus Daviesbacteria bacterium]
MIKKTINYLLPNLSKFNKLTTKIALGIILVTFLFDYQPTLSFPPIKKAIVKAADEQTQSLDAKSLPFQASLPHSGYISTHFSIFHPGIDIATSLGTPIHPISKGIILDLGFNPWGLGLNVLVDHGQGYKSLYAHMAKILVKKGQSVEVSDILGEVGLTGHTSGPHTHLEVSKDNINFDPQTILPVLEDLPKQQFLPIVSSSSATKNS